MTGDDTQKSPWLNCARAAQYLGRSRQFVRREINAGRLRAARIGGRGEILTRAEWLDDYVTRQAEVVDVRQWKGRA